MEEQEWDKVDIAILHRTDRGRFTGITDDNLGEVTVERQYAYEIPTHQLFSQRLNVEAPHRDCFAWNNNVTGREFPARRKTRSLSAGDIVLVTETGLTLGLNFQVEQRQTVWAVAEFGWDKLTDEQLQQVYTQSMDAVRGGAAK